MPFEAVTVTVLAPARGDGPQGVTSAWGVGIDEQTTEKGCREGRRAAEDTQVPRAQAPAG